MSKQRGLPYDNVGPHCALLLIPERQHDVCGGMVVGSGGGGGGGALRGGRGARIGLVTNCRRLKVGTESPRKNAAQGAGNMTSANKRLIAKSCDCGLICRGGGGVV